MNPLGTALPAVCALSLWARLSLAQQPDEEKVEFHPPELLAAGDLAHPILSVAYGTVVLTVPLGETGEVEDVEVVHDIASLTPDAIRAVKSWKFRSAMINGRPLRSRTIVAVMFNPPFNNPADVPPPLPAPAEPAPRGEQDPPFRPPEVVASSYARYPPLSVAFGAVVLQAMIDQEGKCQEMQVIRDIKPLTTEAIRSVRSWKFKPAAFRGEPLAAKIPIAIVFSPLQTGT